MASDNLFIRFGSVFEASASGTFAVGVLLLIVFAMLGYSWLKRRI